MMKITTEPITEERLAGHKAQLFDALRECVVAATQVLVTVQLILQAAVDDDRARKQHAK